MKNLKYKILFSALIIGSAVTLAQTVAEHLQNPSSTNAMMMEENLNFPNATNPARNNIQMYEKDGVMLGANIHTETDLANSYHRNRGK
jgi:uracil DNA glycosylase